MTPREGNAQMKRLLAALAVVVLTAGACSQSSDGSTDSSSTQPPECDSAVAVIEVNTGKLCGIVATNAQNQQSHAYLGIPFAKPPVDDLRWKPPVALDSLPGDPFQATQLGDQCIQPSGELSGFAGSEDCLYLNVYRPSDSTKTDLPVMVWIPGGGFIVGQGGEPVMEGTALVNQDVVLVTMNYRLGSLGYLRYTDEQAGIGGNFGIQDQQLAMKWAKDNIGNFGGNPQQITLFGESAGAMSTGLHLFSVPESNDLFQAAIMESNIMSPPFNSAAKASEYGRDFVDLLCGAYSGSDPCPASGEWLRSLTTEQVAQSQNLTLPSGGLTGLLTLGMTLGMSWAPTVDVAPITGQPIEGYHPGNDPKPYAFGVNHNEGVFFLPAPSTMTPAQFDQAMTVTFGAKNLKKIKSYSEDGKELYNPSAYEPFPIAGMTSASQALGQLQTDYAVAAANMKAASKALPAMQAAGLPSFGYHFVKDSGFNFAGMLRCNPPSQNICHTTEMPYVFSNFLAKNAEGEFVPAQTVTDEERKLGDLMTQAWANFAKNPSQGLGYPKITEVTGSDYVVWDSPVSTGQLIPTQRYDFWQPILP